MNDDYVKVTEKELRDRIKKGEDIVFLYHSDRKGEEYFLLKEGEERTILTLEVD